MPEEMKKVCICELKNGKYICLATGTDDCALPRALQLEYQAYKSGIKNTLFYNAKDAAAQHNHIQRPDFLHKFNCTACSFYFDYIKQNQK